MFVDSDTQTGNPVSPATSSVILPSQRGAESTPHARPAMSSWENMSDPTLLPVSLNRTPHSTAGDLDPNSTDLQTLDQVLNVLQLYYTPLIVVLGVCGNIASMLVLFLTKLRGQSSSFYLSALAASDTGFLLTQLVGWLEEVKLPLFSQPVVCQLTQYVANCCSLTSAWFVVAFTVERFVAVCYPLHRPSFCTVHRAKMVIAALTIISALVNVYALVIIRPIPLEDGQVVCDIDFGTYPSVGFWLTAVDMVVSLVLPFLLIVLLNVQIARAICRLELVRRMMYVSSAEHGTPRANSQQKITKMLLIVSSVFLLLNLPAYAIRVWAFIAVSTYTQQTRLCAPAYAQTVYT